MAGSIAIAPTPVKITENAESESQQIVLPEGSINSRSPDKLNTTTPSRPRPKFNSHNPLQKYQLTHNLLYERHFFGESYISAHLRRLQNGVFVSPNIHPASCTDQDDEHFSKTYVTFAAISFTLHPLLSEDHRFTSAVIEIKATNDDGEALRVLRFAPHLAFGRISSASLKWNFQEGQSRY